MRRHPKKSLRIFLNNFCDSTLDSNDYRFSSSSEELLIGTHALTSILVVNSNPEVLFISNEIDNEELFEAAIRDNVLLIGYDCYGGDSFDSLITRLEDGWDGREARSIGFVIEECSGTVEFFQNNFLNVRLFLI